MRADGDEADVTVALANRLEVGVDDREAGELALSARVRLEGDRVEAGDDGEVSLELLDEFLRGWTRRQPTPSRDDG